MATFNTLPGVQAKRDMALKQGFDPGLPLENEHWPDPNHGSQQFEKGYFKVTKHRGVTGDGPTQYEVDYQPDTDDLLNALKSHFTPA